MQFPETLRELANPGERAATEMVLEDILQRLRRLDEDGEPVHDGEAILRRIGAVTPRRRTGTTASHAPAHSLHCVIALVTGASSGIGEATARRLAREPGDVRLVLVARRGERLRAIAAELEAQGDVGVTVVAADLTDAGAPARIAAQVKQEHGRLDLLVNNAGAAWRARFAKGGWENVRRHMELNFDAQVRLTEALLPLLRSSAPSAIVNVSSTAGRVGRGGTGAYSAAKFALAGWTDSLHLEEAPHGVHVGLVLPGFVATEGFPQKELVADWKTRWIVSTPEKVAEAILDAGPGGRAERYVPRVYWLGAVARIVLPRFTRRVLMGGRLTPATKPRDTAAAAAEPPGQSP